MVNYIRQTVNYKNALKGVGLGILLSIIIFPVHSQVTTAKNAFEIGGGATTSGASFYGAYVRYFKDNSDKVAFGHLPCPGEKSDIRFLPNRMYGKASLFYESGSKDNIDYHSTGMDLAFYYSLLKIKSVFLNAKGGVTASSDNMQSSSDVGPQVDYSGFNYGVLAGGEVEWFISPRLALVGGLDHRFHFNNEEPFDNLRWFAYGGVRFNLVKKVDRIF